MRRSLPFFLAFFTVACVVLPPPGAPVPPRIEILKNDPRAARYGVSAAEILNHPELRDNVPRLFGADWSSVAERGRAASAFFSKSFPTSVLRVEGSDYIAASGCVPEACLTHRGLLLIRTDRAQLLARLDEGGFTRYYALRIGVGIEGVGTLRDRETVDAAWRALERASESVRTREPEGRTPASKLTWRDKAGRCYEDVRRGATVYYEGRHRGRYLVGRAACDQYVEDMEFVETQRRPADPIQPLEILQLESELRRPSAR